MAHHPGTARLAVGDGDGWIMVVDTADWSVVEDFRAVERGPVWALAFSADGITLYAGGIDDVVHAWPVAGLDEAATVAAAELSFLRDPDSMANGERQFMRKCSVCHELTRGPSRRAGPTLHGLFGRRAGAVEGYRYSETLDGSDLIWDEASIGALFEQGPDHYVPGSKMPMQVIAAEGDRAALIAYLARATERTE
jgi:cytochrome c